MSESTFRHIFLQKLSPKHYFRLEGISIVWVTLEGIKGIKGI